MKNHDHLRIWLLIVWCSFETCRQGALTVHVADLERRMVELEAEVSANTVTR